MTTQTQKFALIKYATTAVGQDHAVDKDEMYHQRRLKVQRMIPTILAALGGGMLGAGHAGATDGSVIGQGLLGAGIGGALGYGAGVLHNKATDYMGFTPFMSPVQTIRR